MMEDKDTSYHIVDADVCGYQGDRLPEQTGCDDAVPPTSVLNSSGMMAAGR
jgi:hypothetical protein